MKRRNYSGFLIPILLLAVWHLAGILSIVPAYILPSPSKIFLIGWDFIAGDMEISPYSGTFICMLQQAFKEFLEDLSWLYFWVSFLDICQEEMKNSTTLSNLF